MNRRAGITLIEVMVVVGIIGVLAAAASPSIRDLMEQRRIRGFAREVSGAFQIARSEAMRTGENYVVFFGPPGTTDPAGNALSGPIMVLNDGNPATANCHIEGGEDFETVPAEIDVGWGVTGATVRVPIDSGGASFTPPQSSGSTFADPSNTATNWVVFRPDGVPVGVSGTSTTCGNVGDTGTGGAALYFTNGQRDYAVSLSPLGAVRVHVWSGAAWTL